MLVAIVGGRLQGVEVACLARNAGWRTLLVDKSSCVPAQRLCDHFLQLDVRQISALSGALKAVDLVIPALEDQTALDGLVQWGRERHVPVAFDPDAYAVSSSKIDSDRLFASLGIPTPEPWPRCGFPVVAKPSRASGSDGVVILKSQSDAREVFPNGFPENGWVFQQYLDGPSFSLEVIGRPGNYVPLQVTELFMDAVHDCKAVAAPCRLTAGQIREIETLSVKIAEALRLNGLMDVEVILHEGRFKVLEIDARFPSQTPLAVYGSMGCNMVEMLADLFLPGKPSEWRSTKSPRGARLDHIRVTSRAIFVEGEHIMADAGPLDRVSGFFGADEAITSYREGAPEWVATVIVTGDSRERAVEKRNRVLASIRNRFNLEKIVDRFPENRP
ncbi:MAG: 3-methylornithine--L-lysine ligase PylC [Desulfosarcina sp.]|nr:3-methylornithine--L-lysine ligase PylC [Desulfosarcina sp.]MBC2741818.1 3-methylornithine--L-lysine ligase PylC [Desulfosarcina sp.]MBC2764732.1 3-methylornithine--L-lysine ligase PylC [Desulfosarcina sp.]